MRSRGAGWFYPDSSFLAASIRSKRFLTGEMESREPCIRVAHLSEIPHKEIAENSRLRATIAGSGNRLSSGWTGPHFRRHRHHRGRAAGQAGHHADRRASRRFLSREGYEPEYELVSYCRGVCRA